MLLSHQKPLPAVPFMAGSIDDWAAPEGGAVPFRVHGPVAALVAQVAAFREAGAMRKLLSVRARGVNLLPSKV